MVCLCVCVCGHLLLVPQEFFVSHWECVEELREAHGRPNLHRMRVEACRHTHQSHSINTLSTSYSIYLLTHHTHQTSPTPLPHHTPAPDSSHTTPHTSFTRLHHTSNTHHTPNSSDTTPLTKLLQQHTPPSTRTRPYLSRARHLRSDNATVIIHNLCSHRTGLEAGGDRHVTRNVTKH